MLAPPLIILLIRSRSPSMHASQRLYLMGSLTAPDLDCFGPMLLHYLIEMVLVFRFCFSSFGNAALTDTRVRISLCSRTQSMIHRLKMATMKELQSRLINIPGGYGSIIPTSVNTCQSSFRRNRWRIFSYLGALIFSHGFTIHR